MDIVYNHGCPDSTYMQDYKAIPLFTSLPYYNPSVKHMLIKKKGKVKRVRWKREEKGGK